MINQNLKLLVVSSRRSDRESLQHLLGDITHLSFHVTFVDTVHEATRKCRRNSHLDAILLDLPAREQQGLDAVRTLKDCAPDVPVVVLGSDDQPSAMVTAIESGAQNFLTRERLNTESIMRALRYPIERFRRGGIEDLVRATESEFEAAKHIQQRLFPSGSPKIPGIEVGGVVHPAAATGGDYYDYISLPNGGLIVAVGDVSGHGFGPALLMAMTRAYVRAFARLNSDVSEILNLLNTELLEDTEEDRFVTLVLLKLDPSAGTLSYASAGHPPGYVLDSFGGLVGNLVSTGPPLSVIEGATFPSQTMKLEPGQLVLLMTDGIAEAMASDDSSFGTARAIELVQQQRKLSSHEIAENLCTRVREFCGVSQLPDDVTVVVAKVKDADFNRNGFHAGSH